MSSTKTKKTKKDDVLEVAVLEDGASTIDVPDVSIVDDTQSTTTLTPITSAALKHYDEATQKEIMRIADEIDVTQFEKIMAYGSIPIIRSFESAGKILQNAQGSSADQEVVKMVTELAKQAKDSYDLVIEEPNFIEKLWMKITAGLKNDSKEVKIKAISCFKILEQYIESCDRWIENLQQAHAEMMLSAKNKKRECYEVEQYILAGKIANERITEEVEAAKKEWEETGLIEQKDRYDMLSEGLDMFQIVLLNLEKTRGANAISLGQLALEVKTNRNIQIGIRTQKIHSSAVVADQLEKAYFDAVNREALEGQKGITKLNDELMKKVSLHAKLTAEESERILTDGIYTDEAALFAAQTVIDGYNIIKKIREERVTERSTHMEKLKSVVDELAPYVENLKKDCDKTESKSAVSDSSSQKGLVF